MMEKIFKKAYPILNAIICFLIVFELIKTGKFECNFVGGIGLSLIFFSNIIGGLNNDN